MKNHEQHPQDEIINELKQMIRTQVGGFAAPDHILVHNGMFIAAMLISYMLAATCAKFLTCDSIVIDLPKTRSGKIMRRILRKVASKEYADLGDTSTLSDPDVVNQIIEKRKALG
jgi:acetyl-CoA synthetase